MPNNQFSGSSNNSTTQGNEHKERGRAFFPFGHEHGEWWGSLWQVKFEMSVRNPDRSTQSDTADAEQIARHYHVGSN